MKKLFFIFLLLFPVGLSARESDGKKPSRGYAFERIQVYETTVLDQPFIILGKVRVKSSSLKQLTKKIRKIAEKEGGDAVLGFKAENPGVPSMWTGGQISYAEGIIVKFDENGIKKITADTPVAVLE